MLIRTDPFRDLDRLTEPLRAPGTAGPNAMDAYREAGTFVVHLDLPAGSAEHIDLTVEQNVPTVHAERKPPPGESAEGVVDKRPYGMFSRQLFLGDTLDADRLKRARTTTPAY